MAAATHRAPAQTMGNRDKRGLGLAKLDGRFTHKAGGLGKPAIRAMARARCSCHLAYFFVIAFLGCPLRAHRITDFTVTGPPPARKARFETAALTKARGAANCRTQSVGLP